MMVSWDGNGKVVEPTSEVDTASDEADKDEDLVR